MKHAASSDITHQQDPSTDSFDILYNQYVKKVSQKCLSMTKDSDIAQDYTQDIFIKAFTKLDTFKNRSSFSTWLFSITHNYCLDQLKINKRNPAERISDEHEFNLRDSDYQESTDFQLQQLEQLLAYMPADEVTLLRLKHEYNFTIKQLSERYQVSESAIKMRLKRSRDKLLSLYQAS